MILLVNTLDMDPALLVKKAKALAESRHDRRSFISRTIKDDGLYTCPGYEAGTTGAPLPARLRFALSTGAQGSTRQA